MSNIYMEISELLDCYVRDVNEYDEVFLSIKKNEEVTLIDSSVYLVTDELGEIKGLYGRNANGIREYFNLDNIDTIKFCKRTRNGVVDAVGYDEADIPEEA